MEEVWAKIPGFPGYEISNTGKIFKIGKTKRIPIKVGKSGNYVYASLTFGFRQSKQVAVKHILDQCFTEHVYSDHSSEDLPGEIWKDVVDWEEAYEVSNLGRIRSKERMRPGKNGSECHVFAKIKDTYIDDDGYERLTLYCNNKSKLMAVHRIVAQAFIPNPNNLLQVNHIDGNKLNNKSSNLEWMTNTQNIRHSIATGLRDPATYAIPIIRLDDNTYFKSISELHSITNMSYNKLVHLFKISNGGPILIDGKQYKYAEVNIDQEETNDTD